MWLKSAPGVQPKESDRVCLAGTIKNDMAGRLSEYSPLPALLSVMHEVAFVQDQHEAAGIVSFNFRINTRWTL